MSRAPLYGAVLLSPPLRKLRWPTAWTQDERCGGKHGKIAQAVAALLFPTITAAVDGAASSGIEQLRRELDDHAKRLTEAELHLSDVEDELHQSQLASKQVSQTQQYLLEKIDDLGNCSSGNTLRINRSS